MAEPCATWETITGCENLLILAPHPGDESRAVGGLVAQSCRRGRPPFVMVLTDGSRSSNALAPDLLAARHERETRAAVRRLGLPAHRLLMAGLFDGSVPLAGPRFEAVVGGITLVMWARDCNVICVVSGASDDHRAALEIARAVAARSGVGLLVAGDGGLRLDISRDSQAKAAAVAEHAADGMAIVAEAVEVYQAC
jgi:LmbE family N-acetylglucosaminyl deacetylase